ncbi:hypothetical protein BJ138DRAFT_1142887 [Hygrophoropsis aurantiaca]|uniref:Uncharacterized protein n=1 Tax=Hygrophoropsis aurantiaca TaxID=72124 RepID=A0ACB8ANG6_9AGAM|nr:hypothetical protein BJ138DRAFT_1142887 [Hygrophoropsis aurantiaca]
MACLIYLILSCLRKRGIIHGQDTRPRPFSYTPPENVEAAFEFMPVIDISSRNNSLSSSTPPPAVASRPRTTVTTNLSSGVPAFSSPHSIVPGVSIVMSPSASSPSIPLPTEITTTTITPPSRSRTMPSSYHPARTRYPPSNSSHHRPSDFPLRSSSGPAAAADYQPRRTRRPAGTRHANHSLRVSRSTDDIYHVVTIPQRSLSTHANELPPLRGPSDPAPLTSTDVHRSSSLRPTNHLRHYKSASPVVSDLPHRHRHRHRDVSAPIIIQHRDGGGVMASEQPPPYRRPDS